MNNQNVVIENKLLAKDEFLQLDKLLNRFNIFEATDMGKREVKHTKFLSYLLNPNESHGLGEIFIKNFVTRISEKCEKFPRILDLDFSFAEITAEFELQVEDKKASLDCLIKIPFRRDSNRPDLIIAVENKLDSKQGSNQLVNYRIGLENHFKKNQETFLIFLTFNFELPLDNWTHITYEDIVLPAVESTIEILEETGSLHLKASLKNYYELMMEDAEGQKEKDELANQLIQDADIKAYIKKNPKSSSKERRTSFDLIYVKHRKAIDYLCQYDADIRSTTLRWWNNAKNYKFENGTDSELTLKFETSIRRYLRFNILTESNRNNLIALAHRDKKWLDNKCPIAFEIIMDDNNLDENNTIKCRVTLTLGPVNSPEERVNLLKAIYPKLMHKEFKEENCSEYTNRLISNDENRPKSDVSDPKEWIKSSILKINDKNKTVELTDWVKQIAVSLNDALDAYFKNSIKVSSN